MRNKFIKFITFVTIILLFLGTSHSLNIDSEFLENNIIKTETTNSVTDYIRNISDLNLFQESFIKKQKSNGYSYIDMDSDFRMEGHVMQYNSGDWVSFNVTFPEHPRVVASGQKNNVPVIVSPMSITSSGFFIIIIDHAGNTVNDAWISWIATYPTELTRPDGFRLEGHVLQYVNGDYVSFNVTFPEPPRVVASGEMGSLPVIVSPMSITTSGFNIRIYNFAGSPVNYNSWISWFATYPTEYVEGSTIVPPTVTSNAASNVSNTTATLNGNLDNMGGATSCTVWFQWGLTTSYGQETIHQTKTSTGLFSAGLTGLTPEMTYHFRAVASNSAGTSYGADQTFTTHSNNQNPIADFRWEPTNPYADESTTFISTSTDPNNDIIEWTWLIQDYGKIFWMYGPWLYSLSGETINYVFKEPGLHLVCLIVRDSEGHTASVVKYVDVLGYKKCALIIQAYIDDFGYDDVKGTLLSHGWDSDNIINIAAQQISTDTIETKFHNLESMANIGDKVLVWLSSHGGVILDYYYYLKFSDWWPQHESYGNINNLLHLLPFGTQKSIVIDACHSGGGMSALTEDLRVVLCSCKGDETCGGGFADIVLEGYNGPADKNHNGMVSTEETYAYAMSYPGVYWNVHPQKGDFYPSISNPTLELDLVSTNQVDQNGQGITSGSGGSKHINNSKQTEIVHLDSTLTDTIFSLCWSNGSFNFTLQKPDGSIIDPENATADPNIVYVNASTFTAYQILTPMPGEWHLIFDTPSEDELITYQVSGSTDITINMSLDKKEFYKEEDIKIDVNLSFGGEPLDGASVLTHISKPDGYSEQLSLYDDGVHEDGAANDGWYANSYTNADINGSYQFMTKATGTIDSEPFSRESSSQSAYLMYLSPFANASGPYIGDVNQAIQFDGSSSYDNDGTIASYLWDFGDGENGTGITPQHIYPNKGVYNVTLTVTDNDELTNHAGTFVYVGVPYVEFIYPKPEDSISGIIHIKWYAVNSTGNNDLDISIFYSMDLGQTWNPIAEHIENTGVFDFNTSIVPEGTYVLKIDAIDNVDEKGTGYSGFVTISQAPTNPLKPSGPCMILSGNEYTFSTSATDPEGGPLYYLWDWGDGTTSEWLGPIDSGETIEAKHIWFISNQSNTTRIEIKVIAKDIAWIMSNFSESLTVEIINASMLKTKLFLGLITNTTIDKDFTCFNVRLLLSLSLNPLNILFYNSGERLIVSNYYQGILTSDFIVGLFESTESFESLSSTIGPFRERIFNRLYSNIQS